MTAASSAARSAAIWAGSMTAVAAVTATSRTIAGGFHLIPFGHQQVGDEVAAEHEKDVDPEEAPGKCGQLLMKSDNGNNGQSAQPIQARPS